MLRLEGLPPLRHVAAGHGHALLSDGVRVWAMGRWLSAEGRRVGVGWGRVQLVLDLDDAGGVASLAAGTHASAAVSNSGDMYFWGKLMQQVRSSGLQLICIVCLRGNIDVEHMSNNTAADRPQMIS